jgi:hypothetical protein
MTIEHTDLVDPTTGQALIVPKGIFTEGLKQSVELALKSQVPDGQRGALLAVVDGDGIRAGAVVKIDKKGNWKFSADASKQWGGPVSGRIVLVGSF